MGSRISGFGDIHQGASGNGVGFIQIGNFLLSVQYLIPAIPVKGTAFRCAIPERYIGAESGD
jgi:hypothetical protein